MDKEVSAVRGASMGDIAHPEGVKVIPADANEVLERELAAIERRMDATPKIMNLDDIRQLYVQTAIPANSDDTQEFVKLSEPEIQWLIDKGEIVAVNVTHLDGENPPPMLLAPGLSGMEKFEVFL